MIKLVLWDYTGNGEDWCEKFLKPNVAQIIRTLKPDDADQAEFILRGDWDYVLIFTAADSKEIFDEMLSTMSAMNFPTKNIISVTNFKDWLKNPAAFYSLLNPTTAERVFRWMNFENHGQWHRYVACDAEELYFIGMAQDDYVILPTYTKNEIFAANEMQAFHALAKKFYGVDDSDGYFLDLGANIGTTGIYFLKKLAPNLKLFVVEPDAENFKLLRVNLILNDLDSRATLINCGLGDKFDEMTMYRNARNPGNNGFIPSEYKTPGETIQIAPLDYLLAESEIAPEEVKYIWIDTEGFEAQVLFGAKNLLAKSNAPVFMECNLLAWKNSGTFERMVDLLKTVGYRRYIWVEEFLHTGNEIIYPLDALNDFVKDAPPPLGRIGDIFLIKNL